MKLRSEEEFIQFSDLTKKLVVITTVSPWHEPPRIRHQVASHLSNHFNVLYVQTWPVKQLPPKKVNDSLIVVTTNRLIRGLDRIGPYAPWLISAYRWYIAKRVIKCANQYSSKLCGIINFNFNFPEIFEIDKSLKRIYICNDDFINMADDFINKAIGLKRKKWLASLENRLVKNSTIVLAVSLPLLNRLSEINKNAELFLPATDCIEDISAATEPIYKAGQKIHVVFMGYINLRLNIEWLEELGKSDEFIIRLIGKVEPTEPFERLKDYPNIIFEGPFYGTKLVESLVASDVLIIPYDITGIHSAAIEAITASNKLFTYLCSGRPIVISNMKNYIHLPEGFLYRASNSEEFADQIRLAASQDTLKLRKARIAFAKENTWDQKIKILIKHLE